MSTTTANPANVSAKASHHRVTGAWRRTPIGRTACFLGSIKLAIPILVLVTAALIAGTYIEASSNADQAKALVYGSWWFITLMAIVCVILVFAVVSRYPWRRKHVGFIIVHASLITLITGGFISLFGRVEGQLPLQEGSASGFMLSDKEQVELLKHENGEFLTDQVAILQSTSGPISLGDLTLNIKELWPNAQRTINVTNDGDKPLEAIEYAFASDPSHTGWFAAGAPGQAGPLRLRLLRPNEPWVTPRGPAEITTQPSFVLNGIRYPIGKVGDPAVPGWTIKSVERYKSAAMGEHGELSEAEGGQSNPAIRVIIEDGKGNVERHTAFSLHPDLILSRMAEGDTPSGAKLVPGGSTEPDELVFQATDTGFRVAYLGSSGVFKEQQFTQTPGKAGGTEGPWTVTIAPEPILIAKRYSHANPKPNYIKVMREGPNTTSVLVAETPEGQVVYLPWNTPTPVKIGGQVHLLRYGANLIELPFTIKLEDFRKLDYPGTAMAMSYESDVSVEYSNGDSGETTIWMNHPLKYEGWKVYQSSFRGDSVSIFSIMRDPGLWIIYVGCIGMCLGIAVMFWSRAYSHGHPGIRANAHKP